MCVNFFYFFKNNIEIIKDFVNVLFWIVTMFIAIGSFYNAKKTLFNPIKTEVTKEQMRLFTDFLNKYSSNSYSLDTLLDYSNILKLTIDMYYLNNEEIDESNCDLEDKNRIEYCKNNLGGIIEIGKNINCQLDMKFNDGDYEIARKYLKTNIIKSKEILNSDFLIQRLFFTLRFQSFFNDLNYLKSNPFIPKNIQKEFDDLVQDIYHNLRLIYSLLENVLSQDLENQDYFSIVKEFDAIKKDHTNKYFSILNNIRKKFIID